MKQIIYDCIGAAGFISLTLGIAQQYGQSVALIVSGILMLAFGIISSRNSRNVRKPV